MTDFTLPALPGALDTVYHVDALALLAALPEGSVDCVVTDPPYNMTNLAFEQAIDWKEFWLQVRRVSKSTRSPAILFSMQPFTTDLIVSNRKGWRDEIVWHKTMPVGFLNANRRPLECHELIEIFADNEPEYFPQMEASGILRSTARRNKGSEHYGHMNSNVYVDDGTRFPRSVGAFAQRDSAFHNTETLHPTQKPLPLLERLIETYTRPGWLILDPFMGSGTTAVAARNLGRRFIGCDLSADYVAIANRRLAQPYTPSFMALIDAAQSPEPSATEAAA